MRRIWLTILTLSTAFAGSARAGVQQATPEQRREMEKRMIELEQQLQDLRLYRHIETRDDLVAD